MSVASRIIVFVVALGLVSFPALAGSVSIVEKFPDTQGQNDFWAQEYSAASGFADLAHWYTQGWYDSPLYPYPHMHVSGSNILMHPSDDKYVVISYQAPHTGTYEFNLTFSDGTGGAGGGCTTRALVFRNSDATLPLMEGNVALNTPAYLVGSVHLDAGQFLRIALDSGDNMNSDATLLSGTIGMPEPGSMAAMGFGLAGLLVQALRRKR